MALYNPPRMLIQIKWQKLICLIPVINVILCAICYFYYRLNNVTKLTRIYRLAACFPTMLVLSLIMSVLPDAVWGTVIYNLCTYLGVWAVSRTLVWDQDRFCKEQNKKIEEYKKSLG